MKNKKMAIGLIVTIIILIGGFVVFLITKDNDNSKVIMVTEALYEPYEFYKGNEIVGIDVEIAKEIAKEMGKKLEIKDVQFDAVLNEIKFGRGDFAAAALVVTEERKEEVDFSIGYINDRYVAIVRKDSSIKSLDDLLGKTASIPSGISIDLNSSDIFKDIEKINEITAMASIEDVKTKKADFAALDERAARNFVKENPELKIIDETLHEDVYAIAVKKGNKELLDVINRVLERLIGEGKIEEYITQYTD